MAKNTAQLRSLWKAYECKESAMVLIPFGPDRIRVAPPTAEAFEALAAVLVHHGYQVDTQVTDSYNCRTITGGSGKSLHSYGIAVDVNWTTNPFLDHPGERAVRYSDKQAQSQRARDVRLGVADTDMTKAMIDDVRRIRTRAGVPVFEWGGSWKGHKDCMHFELDVSPEELAIGIDPATVVGLDAYLAALAPPVVVMPPSTETTPVSVDRYEVIARDGLRLRSGPSKDSDVIRVVSAGTQLDVIGRTDGWALVDFQGDRLADGFMSLAFLRAVVAGTPMTAGAMRRDITGEVTVEAVARMFPNTSRANITANLPHVLAGLRGSGLGDRDMVLMALATIRAETEGFLPISEGRSGFNTRVAPFDRYEPGTSIGADLGNTQPGDGARFKGRGYVQLTGRDNYKRVGRQVGVELLVDPEAANEPVAAGRILAQFLKNNEAKLRAALGSNDLRGARKCINGGSHGFARFRDCHERGLLAIPG